MEATLKDSSNIRKSYGRFAPAAVVPVRSARPALALSALQKRQVKQMTQAPVEHKRLYTSAFAQVSAAVPVNYALTEVPVGDTDITRDGDAIALKKLVLRFQTWMTATGISTNTNNGVRIIVYQWRQMSTGSAPVGSDVLEDISSNHAFNSPYHWDYLRAGMLKILYDKRFALAGAGQNYIVDDCEIPLKGLVQFSNSTGSLGHNKVNLLVMTDDLVVPAPEFSFFSELSFTDS